MTNFLLPAILGVVALVYIFLPLWAGATKTAPRAQNSTVYGVEEWDLDHELGKIDHDEWKARRPELEALERHTAPPKSLDLETLITRFRRARRVELALEAEVLVARARKKSNS